jgi:hypothetical protein
VLLLGIGVEMAMLPSDRGKDIMTEFDRADWEALRAAVHAYVSRRWPTCRNACGRTSRKYPSLALLRWH